MRRLAFTALAACSSAGTSSTDDARWYDAVGPKFPLAGDVDSIVAVDPPLRMIVGVARNEDVPNFVYCDRFIVRADTDVPTLPGRYMLEGIPLGTYLLIVVLVDASPAAVAPVETVPIIVTQEGVTRDGGNARVEIDLFITGEMASDCP